MSMRAPFVTVLVPYDPGRRPAEVADAVKVTLRGAPHPVSVAVDGVEVIVGGPPAAGEAPTWGVRRRGSGSGRESRERANDDAAAVDLGPAERAYRETLVRAFGPDDLRVPLHSFTGSSSRDPAMRFLAAGNLACAGWALGSEGYLNLARRVLEDTLSNPEWGFEDGTWVGDRVTSAKGNLKKPHAYAMRSAWLWEKATGRTLGEVTRATLLRMALARQSLDFSDFLNVPSAGQARRSLLGYNKCMSDMIGAFWTCALFPDEAGAQRSGSLMATRAVRDRCWALWTGDGSDGQEGRWEPDNCLHYGALSLKYLLDAAMLLDDRGRQGLRDSTWLRGVFERLRDCEVTSSGDGVGHGASGTGGVGSHPWGGILTALGVLLDDPTYVYVGAKAACAACAQDAAHAEHSGRKGWESIDGLPRPAHAVFMAAYIPLMLGLERGGGLGALPTRRPGTRSRIYRGMTKFGPQNRAVPCKLVLRTGHAPQDASIMIDLGGKMKSNEDQLASVKAFCARGVCLTNAVRDQDAVPGQERVRLAQDTQSVVLVPGTLDFPQTGPQRLAATGSTERPDAKQFPLNASCYECIGKWGLGAEFGLDESDGDVMTADCGSDAFGMLRLSKYFRPDTRLTRQLVLTAEGVLVVRDDLLPGSSVSGFQCGPLWHLLHPRDEAAHIPEDSDAGENWFAQPVVETAGGRSRLLIFHAKTKGRTVGIADGATYARDTL